jgi:NAD-dependent SIR2 family protein deacetylase
MSVELSDALTRALENGAIGVYVGAGISTLPPSDVPSWTTFNQAILEGLYAQVHRFGYVWTPLYEAVNATIQRGNLPDVYLSQIIVNRIGRQYFPVLASLNSDNPNAVHFWLASVAKRNRLPVIITTNFDELIEIALERLAVPYLRCVTEEAFEKAYEGIRANDGTTYLLKIHGSLGPSGGHLMRLTKPTTA